MTELHDALNNCLEAMTKGTSLEGALEPYAHLSSELRPLLEASVLAKGASRLQVPAEVRRRGRSRLLQRVRETTDNRSSRRGGRIPFFPRLAITTSLVAALVVTSTGLVSASSSSLPGQQLYPVKRTWESVRLVFAFSPEQRDLIQSSFEQERLNEIDELLGKRLAAPITFSGLLVRQSDGHWLISGIPVAVNPATNLPGSSLAEGAPVSVTGFTRPDGVVEAQQIEVLQPGASLPPFEPSGNNDREGGSSEDGVPTPVTPRPTPGPTQSSATGTESEQAAYQFSGVVQSMQGNVWQINGQTVYVESAQISGQVSPGSIVMFKGYYGADGRFVVTSIETQTGNPKGKHGGSGGGSGGSEGGGEGEGGSDGP